MRGRADQADRTYTTSHAKARAENRDKKGSGDEDKVYDVAEPVDLVHCNSELGGS